jgi:hypothetical protein
VRSDRRWLVWRKSINSKCAPDIWTKKSKLRKIKDLELPFFFVLQCYRCLLDTKKNCTTNNQHLKKYSNERELEYKQNWAYLLHIELLNLEGSNPVRNCFNFQIFLLKSHFFVKTIVSPSVPGSGLLLSKVGAVAGYI